MIYLTVLLCDADIVVSDPRKPVAETGRTEHPKPSKHAVKPSTTDENESDRETTLPTTDSAGGGQVDPATLPRSEPDARIELPTSVLSISQDRESNGM